MTVAPEEGRRLYYYLASAENGDDDAPLIIWLTGGPGCSSLDAFAYEHGPFTFRVRGDGADGGADGDGGRGKGRARAESARDVVLERNPHAWSKVANVLYVDSPAGTGMSYARDAVRFAAAACCCGVVGLYVACCRCSSCCCRCDEKLNKTQTTTRHTPRKKQTDAQAGLSTDDAQTTEDLLALVLGVLEAAPDLKYKEVVVAGESYAGVYVPLLAERILRHNDAANLALKAAAAAARAGAAQGARQQEQEQQAAEQSGAASSVGCAIGGGGRRPCTLINLIGYVAGNAVTDDAVDGNSQLPYAYGAGLLDAATYEAARRACGGDGGLAWNATRGSDCWRALDAADAAMGAINPYDVGAACFFPRRRRRHGQRQGQQRQRQSSAAAAQRRRLRGGEADGDGGEGRAAAWPFAARFERGRPLSNWWREAAAAAGGDSENSGSSSGGASSGSSSGLLGHTVACADRRAALAYFNDPRVRRAIHAAPVRTAGGWQPCSDALSYRHTAPSMVPVHRRLLRAGVRALVYSGLDDYVGERS